MSTDFVFLDPGELRDDDLTLILTDKKLGDVEKGYLPSYVFEMRHSDTNEKMGEISFRVGNNENTFYGGNSGYSTEENFRGHRYAARSLKLLFPFIKKHNLDEFCVTCNPDNVASRKTCEIAGGQLVEIVDLPPENDQYVRGERKKCRYVFEL
jgi:tagatose 1,6-diphosphate aldolase